MSIHRPLKIGGTAYRVPSIQPVCSRSELRQAKSHSRGNGHVFRRPLFLDSGFWVRASPQKKCFFKNEPNFPQCLRGNLKNKPLKKANSKPNKLN